MPRTQRWRNLSITLLLVAVPALALPWLLPQSIGDGVRIGLFIVGLMALLFGGGGTYTFQRILRARQALDRGDDVIGRWRLTADQWRDFLVAETTLQSGDPRRNDLALPASIPADGIDVVVGRTALRIGDSVHLLPLRGNPEIQQADLQEHDGAPATITLQLKSEPGIRPSGAPLPTVYSVLRFPLPGNAWREARKVVAHYNRDVAGTPDFFHGRGDGSNPEDMSRCSNCGWETHKYLSQCERCGASLQSRRWSRRFGWVIAFCGLVLMLLMGVVIVEMLPGLLQPGIKVDDSRFSGSARQTIGVATAVFSAFLFGVTFLVYGAWQITTGKRNLRLAMLVLGVIAGLMVLGILLAQ